LTLRSGRGSDAPVDGEGGNVVMGITLALLEKLHGAGYLKSGGAVLDIGSSNLYGASEAGIRQFLLSNGAVEAAADEQNIRRLAIGSAYDAVTGGKNDAFVGELLEKADIHYDAIDIADGYKTTILDLNRDNAPAHFIKKYDIVINVGTTEHLLNQYNAFKVIHDSTKPQGYIFHSVPCVGFSNHGYITYTTRCFFDLAGYNNYEVVDLWFDGPGGANDLYQPIQDYSSYFPVLTAIAANRDSSAFNQALKEFKIPDIGLSILLRKVDDRPFMGALEQSTSVGNVPSTVTSLYQAGAAQVAEVLKARGVQVLKTRGKGLWPWGRS
jgi:SAM-dependent methyltransferase